VDNRGTVNTPDLLGFFESSLMKDSRMVVSVGEAAMLIGVSRSHAYELVRRGDLRVINLGRRRVVPKLALLELLGFCAG
jgi:excisionase family DNA binding protein